MCIFSSNGITDGLFPFPIMLKNKKWFYSTIFFSVVLQQTTRVRFSSSLFQIYIYFLKYNKFLYRIPNYYYEKKNFFFVYPEKTYYPFLYMNMCSKYNVLILTNRILRFRSTCNTQLTPLRVKDWITISHLMRVYMQTISNNESYFSLSLSYVFFFILFFISSSFPFLVSQCVTTLYSLFEGCLDIFFCSLFS